MMTQTARLCGVLVLLVLAGACGPAKQAKPGDGADDEILGPRIAEDWNEAEERWRKDIASERWSEDDMNLLTDDPPRSPESYGAVAARGDGDSVSADGAKPGGGEQVAAADAGRWGRLKSGADTFGKASFAVMSVAVTLGMMVAPYFLL